MLTRILLVDDKEAWRDQLRAQLTDVGYEVTTRTSGRDAIKQFRHHQVDLMILALDMHGLSGIDTCRALRKRSIVPIVLIGESVPQEVIVKALEAGADDFFAKTVNKKELAVRLEAVLRRSQPWGTDVYRSGDLDLECRNA